MTPTNNAVDVLNCISAMHHQEQTTPRCTSYFQRTNAVNESCRTAMVDWLHQISDALSLNRETVGLAIHLLDRFLSSCTESSKRSLMNKQKFQLAAITTYYIAVKINEPVELGISVLLKLCRGCYNQEDIYTMERDILFSLEWRISSPTALDFVRQILALIPATDECIEEGLEIHLANVVKDSKFSYYAPSTVAAACVALSFRESQVCLSPENIVFWVEICKALKLDSSDDFMMVQQMLEEKSPNSEQVLNVGLPIATLNKGNLYVNSGEPSSPVSVNV